MGFLDCLLSDVNFLRDDVLAKIHVVRVKLMFEGFSVDPEKYHAFSLQLLFCKSLHSHPTNKSIKQ